MNFQQALTLPRGTTVFLLDKTFHHRVPTTVQFAGFLDKTGEQEIWLVATGMLDTRQWRVREPIPGRVQFEQVQLFGAATNYGDVTDRFDFADNQEPDPLPQPAPRPSPNAPRGALNDYAIYKFLDRTNPLIVRTVEARWVAAKQFWQLTSVDNFPPQVWQYDPDTNTIFRIVSLGALPVLERTEQIPSDLVPFNY